MRIYEEEEAYIGVGERGGVLNRPLGGRAIGGDQSTRPFGGRPIQTRRGGLTAKCIEIFSYYTIVLARDPGKKKFQALPARWSGGLSVGPAKPARWSCGCGYCWNFFKSGHHFGIKFLLLLFLAKILAWIGSPWSG